MNYKLNDAWSSFASFAISSRTPTDAAIYDANDPNILPSLEIKSISITQSGDSLFQFGDPTAASERVYNFELGWEYRQPRFVLGTNAFWMEFRDEIIPYGGINENTGTPITINADRSVHSGIELTAAVMPYENLKFDGNFSYNFNRVKNYKQTFDVGDDDVVVDFKDKTIVAFPDYLANLIVAYNPNHFQLTLRTHHVGRQYMELYNIEKLSIEPYWTASFSLGYTFTNFINMGNVVVQARVDNLFDKKFETSGYGWNWAQQSGGGTKVYGGAEYFVGAERSFYGQVKVELF
jgi:iron complex outermembrane receptor protein